MTNILASDETHYMVNPFEEPCIGTNSQKAKEGSEEELDLFLKWAYTRAQPFDANFLTSIEEFANWAKNCRVGPRQLQEGNTVLSRIDIAIAALVKERERLTELYSGFTQRAESLSGKVSQSQIEEWLAANMPDDYKYVRAVRKYRFEQIDTEIEEIEEA